MNDDPHFHLNSNLFISWKPAGTARKTTAQSRSDGLVYCLKKKQKKTGIMVLVFLKIIMEKYLMRTLRALHRDDERLLCAWLTTKTYSYATCVVSTGWGDSPHNHNINELTSPSISCLHHFMVRWYSLAPSVPWFDCLIITCGEISMHICIGHKPPTVDDLKEAIRVEVA